ncbi:MAG: hypothetical protein R3B84_14800 [Zavarzinella sp.]
MRLLYTWMIASCLLTAPLAVGQETPAKSVSGWHLNNVSNLPVRMAAKSIYHWKDQRVTWLVLQEKVTISQGDLQITTHGAVVKLEPKRDVRDDFQPITVLLIPHTDQKTHLEWGNRVENLHQTFTINWKTTGLGAVRGTTFDEKPTNQPEIDLMIGQLSEYDSDTAKVLEGKSPAISLTMPDTSKVEQALAQATAPGVANITPASTKPPGPPPVVLPPVVPQKYENDLMKLPVVVPPPALPQPHDIQRTVFQEPLVAPDQVVPITLNETRTISLAPRSNQPYFAQYTSLGEERIAVITGGVKLIARFTEGKIRTLDLEADQVVVWVKGGDAGPVVTTMESGGSTDKKTKIELYLRGNVIARMEGDKEEVVAPGKLRDVRTMHAHRLYYDVDNHRALAIQSDLSFERYGNSNTAHLLADRVFQLSEDEFSMPDGALLHASRLPSDPGLQLRMDNVYVERLPEGLKETLFGLPFRERLTGKPVYERQTILEADNVRTQVLDRTVFWWPRLKANVNDPFGPLEGLNFRNDQIFGMQIYSTWDMLELAGVTPLQGEKWLLLADYLSARGPGVGTEYTRFGSTMFGRNAPFNTRISAYMIDDSGSDVLAGNRQFDFQPPGYRGRFFARHQQDFDNWALQTQLVSLSDRNFLEQYYKFDYDTGQNMETFLWLKNSTENRAATLLIQPDMSRNWISETYWLPKVSGYWLNESFLDMFTYNTWASAGYARLDPFRTPPAELPRGIDVGIPAPEKNVQGARLDWMQQIAMPFEMGPVQLTPYGLVDLTHYGEDLTGEQSNRFLGGGGLKTSVALSRLYRDVHSEFFNVNGLFHKNTFNTNYYIAGSTIGSNRLPQYSRLNDDATESAWRNVTPWQPEFAQTFGPKGQALATSNIFSQRQYANRRLVDTQVDTLDSIHAIQFDWNQRWQTKRGYPGLEHTVDWLTLDLGTTIFPADTGDNFGEHWAFLEYAATWNVGDQTGFFSNGWVDPFDVGTRYWTIGTYIFRDDATSFNISYRSYEPVSSKVISVVGNYNFSSKYSIALSTAYDFSYQESLSNAIFFTRTGTDMQITMGITYNSLVKNFGFTFNIVPNLVSSQTTNVLAQQQQNQNRNRR